MKSYSLMLASRAVFGAPKSHTGAHGHGLATLLRERLSKFWLWPWIFTHTPKLGRKVEWITRYLSPSFHNSQFMADDVLSPWLPVPFSFIQHHTEFLRASKGSHGILASGNNDYSHSFPETTFLQSRSLSTAIKEVMNAFPKAVYTYAQGFSSIM